jgi:hypothetical protein
MPAAGGQALYAQAGASCFYLSSRGPGDPETCEAPHRRGNMRTSAFAPFVLFALAAFEGSAQNVWTANATTAVPNFLPNGTVKTTTVDTTIHGRGVRPQMTPQGFGTSFLYIPVTAPNGTTFACVGLRAMDNSPTGAIRAEFVRQPRNANPGPAVTLGAVASVDAPGDGFQFVTAPFGAQVINYSLFTYYIRLDMIYQGAVTAVIPSPIALDVSLSGTCN